MELRSASNYTLDMRYCPIVESLELDRVSRTVTCTSLNLAPDVAP